MTAAVLCKFSCLDKPAGIDGCLDAGFLKHVDYVFGADVSGCIGTKGTAAETADTRLEAGDHLFKTYISTD